MTESSINPGKVQVHFDELAIRRHRLIPAIRRYWLILDDTGDMATL